MVDPTADVPGAGSAYPDAVKAELPHGEVTVNAVEGGLRVPLGDTIIACAAIVVSVEYGGLDRM